MSSEGGGDANREPAAPRLRFPEFRDTAGWEPGILSDLLFEPKEKNRDLTFGVEDVLSVSGEHGCVNQIQLLGRSYAGASVKEYNVVQRGDVVYTKSPLKACPNGIIKANKGSAGIVSVLYAVYRPKPNSDPNFIDYYFSSDQKLNNYLWPLVKKGPKNSILVKNSDVLRGPFIVPTLSEQQKIAACLSSLDAVIAAEAERLAALKDQKKGLMRALLPAPGQTTPSLRFPEFLDAGEWKEKALGEIIHTVTPPKKLQTSQYGLSGDFPIIDQSQDRVAGWTNDAEAVIADGFPFIIFGDHTCVLKLVSEPFVQGADGIKIMRTNGEASVEFVYQSLLNEPMQTEDYKRHFSKLKERPVSYPDRTTGEQDRIADCLSSFDDAVKATSDRVVALKLHKAALMQQLFPAFGASG